MVVELVLLAIDDPHDLLTPLPAAKLGVRAHTPIAALAVLKITMPLAKGRQPEEESSMALESCKQPTDQDINELLARQLWRVHGDQKSVCSQKDFENKWPHFEHKIRQSLNQINLLVFYESPQLQPDTDPM